MAILAECPFCHTKQSTKNKRCKCGADLDKAKGSKKVKYWVSYRLPDGKQRREPVSGERLNPYSIKDAETMHSKRVVQKAENRILDILPEAKMTFQELSDWYLKRKSVKKLASVKRIEGILTNFNKVFGNKIVGSIKHTDLEDYQDKREEQGSAPRTIDYEISVVNTMITKAFYNDMVSGHVLKAFKTLNNRLKKGSNARKRKVAPAEYLNLLDKLKFHRY